MLHYLGSGTRHYGKRPVPVNKRDVWEFQAVVRGEISLLLPEGLEVWQRHWLWIFPPHHFHGWQGRANSAAEVAVFHFPHVPEPLRQQFCNRDFFEMPLTKAQCVRLELLARRARSYWESPAPGMLLCHESILLEISLIVLEFERIPRRRVAQRSPKPIEKSLLWFSKHMKEDPNLDTVSREVGISPAHLRRLFHQTFHTSPKRLFDQLRFQRATQLMADPSQKLEFISGQCGFGSASAFSRAFRNKFGCSPTTWGTRV